jgi:hypothetical protein
MLSDLGFDHISVDECFVAGTQVLTPNGYKAIETIEIGEEVINATGKGIVTHLFNKKAEKLVKISLSNGEVITVTANHPFLTKKGWIIAELLNVTQVLHFSDVHNIMGAYDSKMQSMSKGVYSRKTPKAILSFTGHQKPVPNIVGRNYKQNQSRRQYQRIHK